MLGGASVVAVLLPRRAFPRPGCPQNRFLSAEWQMGCGHYDGDVLLTHSRPLTRPLPTQT
jgi:hypothetical protein